MGSLPGEIDGPRFPRALGRFGWRVKRQRGSHRILVPFETGRVIVVAFHGVIRRGAAHRTLKLAGIDEEAFIEVL